MKPPPPAADPVEAILDRLERDGYAIVEGLLSSADVAAARQELDPLLRATVTGDNSFLGRRTRRLFGLFAKTRTLDGAATSPVTTEVAARLLGPYQLSSTVAVRIDPGEREQTLHTDDSAWPLPAACRPTVVNSIWAIDDFTGANGATHLIPGSHTWTDRRPVGEATTVAEMSAGSVLIYVGSLWHGGGANLTDESRTGVVLEYCSAWLRPQENFALSCPPGVARRFPEALARLLGYEMYPPFVGHVEGRPPGELLRPGVTPVSDR
jgi:ectoine hydroxylase-related dioxygenase (phytanoyl-CoA dioxygenase family)